MVTGTLFRRSKVVLIEFAFHLHEVDGLQRGTLGRLHDVVHSGRWQGRPPDDAAAVLLAAVPKLNPMIGCFSVSDHAHCTLLIVDFLNRWLSSFQPFF